MTSLQVTIADRFNNHAIAMEIDQLAVMEYSRYKGMPCIENKDIYIYKYIYIYIYI